MFAGCSPKKAVLLALVMWRLAAAYSPVASDAARLVSVLNGPVVAHLLECLEGGELWGFCWGDVAGNGWKWEVMFGIAGNVLVVVFFWKF